ncbi:MAG: hypothetical protein M3548_13095, partial [Actinomycetota bacterium]|nr:hypothetical protein [Actinomycetota bacterium]
LWIGPASRLLRTQSWRPAKVRVFRPGRGLPKAKLLVRDGDRTLNLTASALPWAVQQLFARTGRIWLVGPDDKGWVAIRSAGLALPLGSARVTAENVAAGWEINIEQPEPARVSIAAGDAVVARMLATPRRRSRTELIAPTLLMVFAVIVVVDLIGRDLREDQVELVGLVGLAVLGIAALLAWRVRKLLYWSKVDKLLAVGPWTSVPVELDLPRNDTRTRTVTALATLPGGQTVPVTLPRAGQALLANIAGTGQLWVAGTPKADVETVAGLPGYPFLSLARFGG